MANPLSYKMKKPEMTEFSSKTTKKREFRLPNAVHFLFSPQDLPDPL